MGIHIKYFNKKKFLWGCFLVLVGVLAPFFVNIQSFRIPDDTYGAITSGDRLMLWYAALRLVALNSIRACPHYIGAFIIAESIELESRHEFTKWMKPAIVCAIIPVVYFCISNIHHIRYDFGMPALALILLLILLGKNDYNYVSLWKKTMLITVFLTALQFPDIMPCLKSFPIGRGEMSQDVKLVARFLEMEPELDVMALIFFLLLLFMGALLFFLIRDENNLRAMSELKEQNERMVVETKMRVLENRTYIEMRHLVHDLKSPLTSAQALVGVVRMSCGDKGMDKECGYLGRVESSIEKMSGMISEILYENHRTRISSKEILDCVLAQISVSEYSELVHVDNRVPDHCLQVNKIRFTRAIVNLIENAFYAVSREEGRIDLTVDSVGLPGDAKLRFNIRDNGKGIDEDTLGLIWERGFSTRSSHGLGLSFVKTVVTNSGGSIDIESSVGTGTSVWLNVPEDYEEEEQKGEEKKGEE